MKTFNLPDLGEGLQEAEIVTWHVGEGDSVVTEQPVVSVETDKAVVEIPAPYGGRVSRLHAKPGDIVKVGAPLIEFDDGRGADAGTVVGRLPGEDTAPKAAPRPAPTGARAPAPSRPPSSGVKATPAVRAFARELGVDLAEVTPSGPGGLVTKGDVEAAAAAIAGAGGAEPLRGVRRAMARKMAQSHAEVVPCTVTEEADVTAWQGGADITFRLIRAVVAGCRAEPALNVWFDSRAMARRFNERVDIGIAADTEDGLFVPVIRDAGGRPRDALRSELERFKTALRARALPAEDLRDPTITLSNFGALGGGLHGTVIVLPPQVAIVGAGRINARTMPAAAPGGAPEIRRMLPLSVTFDHRAVTGGETARFLVALIADLAAAE